MCELDVGVICDVLPSLMSISFFMLSSWEQCGMLASCACLGGVSRFGPWAQVSSL